MSQAAQHVGVGREPTSVHVATSNMNGDRELRRVVMSELRLGHRQVRLAQSQSRCVAWEMRACRSLGPQLVAGRVAGRLARQRTRGYARLRPKRCATDEGEQR
eukprot:5012559-Prymnesium_polylepis.2